MRSQKTVLIIEDNELNREILSAILEEAQYHVLVAENGLRGLEVLQANRQVVSLIILDIIMPVMDGFTFLDKIKEDPDLSSIPVIVTTQGNSESDELAALNHGATDFLPKPYRPQIILHRVASLIKLRETSAMINLLQYDRLTGVYSREYFFQKVRERLDQDPNGRYCIVCTNIERFKLFNDRFGNREGDRLLIKLVEAMKRTLGSNCMFGRMNADRFLCFMDYEQKMLADQNAYSHFRNDASILPKSIVIRWGIYEIHDTSFPVEQMCDRAMLAADSIKNHYNQYHAVYDDSLRAKLVREQVITVAMEPGLKAGEFVVYLQPQYSLVDKRMIGAEALVRWIHPSWGLISPNEFIPLFEKNGFIRKLDSYVFEQVCKQLAAWRDQGYPLLPISVNISRADLYEGNLVESLLILLQTYNLPPEYLHLEITESAYTDDPEQIINMVSVLRSHGFIIEMDDFGSGYSSLNMLSQMTLDVLKLDMKFVQSQLANPMGSSFLGNIISMAHQSNLTVIAEGIETREQMNRLRAEGCDYAQGYFFAKPMPISEYEELLKEWKPAAASDTPANTHRSAPQSILLVVDEDAEYRKMVQDLFSSSFHILAADNAAHAMQLLNAQEPAAMAAVILSLTLPDQSARPFFNAIRRSTDFWDTPILATIPSSSCACQMDLAFEADDFLCKCHPAFDLHRRVQRMVSLSSFHERECSLRDAANRDPMTGLLNRRGFDEAISSISETDLPLAVCIFDLDNLKTLNDTCGHNSGDCIIRTFSSLLFKQTRADDIKCRYGGDEFILLLKHINNPQNAVERCNTICRLFQKAAKEEDGLSAACSAGIAICDHGERVTPTLIDHADQALYHAKKEKKGTTYLWSE